MLLKKLMEEKKLNFNQPLLSVRRFPLTISAEKDEKKTTRKSLPNIPPLPSYKSKLKSGPVRKPGTVPFAWEHSPGRPKDKSQSQTRSPVIPKTPPGRVLKAKRSVPENIYEKQVVSSVEVNRTKEKESSDSRDGDEGYVDALIKKLTRPSMLPKDPKDKRGEKSDGEDDGFNEPGNLSTKVCGIPKFRLLNPVPGMSVRTRLSMSPASRTQKELTRAATIKKRSVHGPREIELCEYRNSVRNKSNQVRYKSNSQIFKGSSIYKRLQGSGISLPENELPQSRFFPEKRFLDESNGCISPKRCPNSFAELLADQTTEREVGLGNPMVEKTLYVDSVHKVLSPKSNSFSSDGKGIPSVDSSLKEIQNTKVIHEEVFISQGKSSNPADSTVPSSSCKSCQEFEMQKLKGFGQDQSIFQKVIVSANPELPNNGYRDFEYKQQLTKVGNPGTCQGIDSQLPVPPPLPKSPSESWLWRTLPNMSSRNSSSHSHLHMQTMSQQ